MKQIELDLVVLDRLIDEKDCLYFIDELRSQGYGGPILVVSVVDDPQSAINAGASAFLAKPVPPFIYAEHYGRELPSRRHSVENNSSCRR